MKASNNVLVVRMHQAVHVRGHGPVSYFNSEQAKITKIPEGVLVEYKGQLIFIPYSNIYALELAPEPEQTQPDVVHPTSKKSK